MTGLTEPGQPDPAGGRRTMSTGAGILLITVGAVLLFALTAGSPHWLNLRIVGVILMLAGILGLALPRLARTQRLRLRRWAMPDQPVEPSPSDESALVSESGAQLGSRTLADDMLGDAHGPPIEHTSNAQS
jgi:hypothetical protein